MLPQDWHFEVIEPSVFTVEVVSQAEPQSNASGYYVVMYTADWCGPCRQWKAAGNPERMKQLGYPLTIIDIDRNPQYRGTVPRFEIIERATGKRVQIWNKAKGKFEPHVIGGISPEALIAQIPKPVEQSAVQRDGFYNPSIYGIRNTSHESRETLINHLANDGIHRGKHSVAELQLMSDDQLNALHEQDHGWE